MIETLVLAVRRGPSDLPAPDRPPGTARRLADEIARRPEFRDRPRNPLQVARDWIGEQLAKVLDGLVGGHFSAIAVVVLAVIVALVVFLAVRAAKGIRKNPEAVPEIEYERRRPATEWRSEAALHEENEDWRNAVRCHYRALVADLAARGAVDEVPGTTSGEYRNQVALKLPAAAASFAGASEIFEGAWYGQRPTGRAERDRVVACADDVLAVRPPEPVLEPA